MSAPATVQGSPSRAESTTPTLRATARRWRFWLILAAVAVVGLLAVTVASGTGTGSRAPYSITNAAPDGSKALAEVLRQQGVDVVQADTLPEARAAVDAAPGATLAFADPVGYLTDEQLAEAAELADRVVLFLPGFNELRAFAPGVSAAGAPRDVDGVDAGCSLPAAERAGTIIGGGQSYRAAADGDARLCFRSSDDAYYVVSTETPSGTVTVLGAADVLTNEGITGVGNAALALGLLGEDDTLVWYVPTADDVVADGPADVASLTPDWVTPVLVLAVFTFVAAAIWRGRRLGALVVENLPVTVRSRETMEGRARLYAKAGAHTHALDSLRIGTITRLSSVLGLPRNASVDEVASSVAAVLPGWSPGDIRSVLVDATPSGEADLIALSDRLMLLENAVTSAVRP
ncbi:DUF4350 domain-containing protein [Agreia sp. PsM10]|uniref:DUF4350 domain-containing protein n=1 Tax=Agreia sp. PsM10 TaxID=3030533 RepID=UPI00263BE0FE|nr:DUF4350 domain-containing protein [Agreia sp. PsM10]MDN4639328.1 DUF4350 domain-containing protein [Agreia sp. PsM10]